MKSLVITCPCCGARRQFVVDEAEAGRVEAAYHDREPTLFICAVSQEDGLPFTH